MIKVSISKIIKENYSKIGSKNTPVDVNNKSELIQSIQDSLTDMLINTYAPLGGWKGIDTPEDLKRRFTNFYIMDVDEDPEPDVGIYYTSWGDSKKASALVTDSGTQAKVALRTMMKEFFTSKGSWIELSGAPANIALTRLNLDEVTSEKEIRKLLSRVPQEEIVFHGKHPNPKITYGNGWYVRPIQGKLEAKIIVGNPP